MRTLCGIILAAAILAAGMALSGEITVEPDGMSPHEALMHVSTAKAGGDKGAWIVRVKPGVYVLKEKLLFTPADSGTPDAPVQWIGGQKGPTRKAVCGKTARTV